MSKPVNLSDILAQYRNGDRGLLTYTELQTLEKQIAEQAARIKELESKP